MLEMEQVNDINRRIRLLRKEDLKLSQEEFARRINLSQRAVSTIETSGNSITDRNLKAICSAFNVNEHWLRTGEGEIFKEQVIDDLWNAPDVDDLDRKIITSYLKMTPDKRKFIKEWIKELAASFAESEQPKEESETESVPDNELSREEKHRLLDEELDKAEKRQMSAASTTTNGLLSLTNKT